MSGSFDLNKKEKNHSEWHNFLSGGGLVVKDYLMPWPIECVTLGSFFQITLLQAGIYARHTKEQEKYRSYMFYVSIFQRFWTFVLYNYTLQLQGKNGQNKPKNPQN